MQEFLDRQRRPNLDEDYGWLEPGGTFYPVSFGCHQGWAAEYCKKHFPEFKEGLRKGTHHFDTAGDWLRDRGWVLLHNPGMGLARPTCASDRRLTKAQRDFLYGYYIDRDQPRLAEQYLKDEGEQG